MSSPSERKVFKKLLDLTDEIAALRRSQRDAIRAADDLQQRVQRALEQFGRAFAEYPGDSPLSRLVQRHRLDRNHGLLALELLRKRLAGDDPTARGADLLALLFDSSFERLEGVDLLRPEAPLLAQGLVIAELGPGDDESEILDLRFRLSDRAFRFLARVLRPSRGRRRRLDRKPGPYGNHLAHLMDLRRLAALYRKRAALLFHFDEWDELADGLPDSIRLLNREIPRLSGHIVRCLEQTEDATSFPLVKAALEFGLREDDLIILVTLVFQELTQGNPYVDACDLLKLIAHNESDLVRKREVFGAESPLIRHQLVQLEEVVKDKELTAEVYVPKRIVNMLIGGPDRQQAPEIDQASRDQFRAYLTRLEDSDDFFRRL